MIAYKEALYPELTEDDFAEHVEPVINSLETVPMPGPWTVRPTPLSLNREEFPFQLLCLAIARDVWGKEWESELVPILSDRETFVDANCAQLAQLASTYLLRPLAAHIKSFDPSQQDSRQAYRAYTMHTLDTDFEEFSTAFPIAWARCCEHLAQRVRSTNQALRRIDAARNDLAQTMGIPRHARVASVDADGDTHHHGAAVGIVTFDTGDKVVYKPRSVDGEAGYRRLTQGLAAFGLEFRALRVVERPDHGFTEFLTADARSHSYIEAGRIAALMYLLNSTDMHYTNILWTDTGPVPIDLETLFHPARVRKGKKTESPRSAYRSMAHSVYATGVLPLVITSSKRSGSWDVGFIGTGEVTGDGPFRQLEITQPYTRDVAISWRQESAPVPLETSDDRRQEIEAACDQVIAGFRSVLDQILPRKHDFARLVEDSFQHARLRYIHCPTVQYAQILRSLTTVEASRRRELALGLLSRAAILSISSDKAIVASECRQMWEGDLPYFSTSFEGTDLMADGHVVSQIERTPHDAFLAKIDQLTQEEIDAQIRLIRLAFVAKLADPHAERRVDLALTERTEELSAAPAITDDEDTLRAALASVADPLVERILDDRFDHLPRTWIGPVARFGSPEWSPGVLGYDLYGGRVGPALALSTAAGVTGDPRYRTAAEEVFDRSAKILNDQSFEMRSVMAPGTGGFEGLGGLLWSLHSAGGELDHRHWQDVARRSWSLILDTITDLPPEQFDMISGDSSSVVMWRRTDPQTPLDDALVDRWVGAARQRFAHAPDGLTSGLAHGLGQLVWFLSVIAQERPTPALVRLLTEVDACLAKHYRTADGHLQSYAGENSSLTSSWCNGTAGLLVAYAEAARAGIPTQITVDSLVGDIVSRPIPTLPVLCHGALGIVEALRHAEPVSSTAGLIRREMESTVCSAERIADYFRHEQGRYALSPGAMSGRSGAVLHLSGRLAGRPVPSPISLTTR